MLDRHAPAPLLLLGAAAGLAWRGLRASVRAAWRALRRHHGRQYLSGMDARMLRDIGADPMIAWRESRKWWWQVSGRRGTKHPAAPWAAERGELRIRLDDEIWRVQQAQRTAVTAIDDHRSRQDAAAALTAQGAGLP